MSQVQVFDVPRIGCAEVDLQLRDSRDWLAERGELVVGSGVITAGRLSGSLHSDFGPQDQDKATNQDYALAWWPTANGDEHIPRFVLAMADGLTSSFRSESAAALACWVAVRALVEARKERVEPRDLARQAFSAAGHAIGHLVDELARDPQTSCPEGQFLSTWKYILAQGRLLETTLTLVWLERDHLRMAMVGDGGALWRDCRATCRAFEKSDRVLAACDVNCQQVHALGPSLRSPDEFDCWHDEELKGPFLCVLSTDGIGRSRNSDPGSLLDELDRLEAAGAKNPARRFIEHAVRERPDDFDDNLTLAVLRAK